jgi:hypothetical protein
MCTDNLGKISSQWDGLRHYGYQNLKKYYNGATCDEINSSSTLGIQGKPAPIIPAERKTNKITSMVQTRDCRTRSITRLRPMEQISKQTI